jgi:hypothetical protein
MISQYAYFAKVPVLKMSTKQVTINKTNNLEN